MYPSFNSQFLETRTARHQDITFSYLPQDARKACMLVCRRWKNIFLDNPTLWTLIFILRTERSNEEKHFRRHLFLSRDEPIDIVVVGSEFGSSPVLADPVLELIHQNLARVHALSGQLYSTELQCIFPSGKLWELPALRILHVFSTEQLYPRFEIGGLSAPRLVHLSFDQPDLALAFTSRGVAQNKSLQYLCIQVDGTPVPVRAFLDFVASCPNIRRFSFMVYRSWIPLNILADIETWPVTRRVTLPKLFLLAIGPYYSNDTILFLRCLHCPELRVFRCLTPQDHDPIEYTSVFKASWHILRECAMSLTYLILKGQFLMRDNFMESLISRLDNLLDFSLINVSLPPWFFEIFLVKNRQQRQPWSCPKLRTLRFDVLDIEGNGLGRLIRLRSPPDSGQNSSTENSAGFQENCIVKDTLTSVRIKDCCFLEDEVYAELLQLEQTYSNTLWIEW
ncbi:hypothetical protein M422DRAFT_52042 [Sphaerobolus stellatus SS14]|uniref:F-box domain-containing protein n=1 Tax=Sphaerobolus stellatus (strain SS14) TaxID=990650 RepID=A0A0C9V9W9_SPHS4|nr:hypothetical protein M422DRAFT_52042 [Sphaerobolus stellatus SS14]